MRINYADLMSEVSLILFPEYDHRENKNDFQYFFQFEILSTGFHQFGEEEFKEIVKESRARKFIFGRVFFKVF